MKKFLALKKVTSVRNTLCGILILFLYSNSFGYTDSEYFRFKNDFCSQDRNQANLLSLASFDDSSILPVFSEETRMLSTIRSLSGYAADEFQYTNMDFSAGSDSLKMFMKSGDCSQGYITNTYNIACTGSIIDLNSRTALTYQWSPASRFSDAEVQNPSLTVDSTRTYYLETTIYTNNLIVNPDFELGNTGFFTTYTYCDGVNCLWPLGDNGYSIGTNAADFNTYFTGTDHTSGSGNFMIVNGARPTLTVWQQTIPVKPGTKYAFGVWISTMISLSPAQIRFSINGGQVGSLYNAPVYANNWEQVFTAWYSGNATSATITIEDIMPILLGNDFGLDDLFFGEIATCTDSITVAASRNVNLGHDTIITPPDQHIVLTDPGGYFDKYNWSTGDTTQSISITEPGKYWLSATDLNGCKSADTINIKNSRVFVKFPNAFTPNIVGSNDVFRPTTSNVSKFHMSIYNRWGQFLFETSNIETGWNGVFKGEKCPAGLYVYIATYEFQDETEMKTTRGSFNLIR